MAAAVQLEALDLRHFSAAQLRPLLEEEGRTWGRKLWWDYRNSVELLLGYFDARSLPGYVALADGAILGYAFCVYEGHKAIVGDVFAVDASQLGMAIDPSPHVHASTETFLLRHLLETLQNSPAVNRIESQLLLPDYGTLRAGFIPAGFVSFRRLLLEHSFGAGWTPAWKSHNDGWRNHLTLRQWKEDDFPHAAALIHRAYQNHIDSAINDQYRSIQGAQRFLHNIVRFPGCGFFDPTTSRVAYENATGQIAGMVLCSRVRADVGHITQLCVDPKYRRLGLAHALLDAAEADLRYHRFAGVTLTVTAENKSAIDLYTARGFKTRHAFEAFVWEK
jgi:ribosomal protein S18 acetylase RimI-like enzyme